MKRRLFVAVSIPENIKKEIYLALDRVPEGIFSFARVVPEENRHITVKFLGERSEIETAGILRSLEKAAEICSGKNIEARLLGIFFDSYIPPRKLVVMADKETSLHIGEIKKVFEKQLENENIKTTEDGRSFEVHITIARFSRAPGVKDFTGEELNISFPVKTVTLFESRLPNNRFGSPKFDVLKIFQI